jgi:hypothetical protein
MVIDTDVHLGEVAAELGANAFGALKKGRYGRSRQECRITTPTRENVIAQMADIASYVLVWVPHEAMAADVRPLSQFTVLGADFTIHEKGLVRSPVYVAQLEDAAQTIVLGKIVPLPAHAILSSYDVGDTVLIMAGAQQGRVCRVRAVQETTVGDQKVYDLVEHDTWRGAGQHIASGIAALFPGGDRGRYAEIQPGNVRYPPGTRVAYAGESGWVVLNWRRGLAELYRLRDDGLREESVVTAEKVHLAAEL